MIKKTEQFFNALNSLENYAISVWEIFNTDDNSWYRLDDVLSFDIVISRDDNRPVVYSLLPPISKANIKINNFLKHYSFSKQKGKILITPDAKVRCLIGYKTDLISKKYMVSNTKTFKDDGNIYINFLECEYRKNITFSIEGNIIFKHFDNIEDIYEEFNSLYKIKNFEYRNKLKAIYVSKIINIAPNDSLIKESFIKTVEVKKEEGLEIKNNLSSKIYFLYRLSDSKKNIKDEEFLICNNIDKLTEINKTGRVFQFAILYLENDIEKLETKEREEKSELVINNIFINVKQYYELETVFLGMLDTPKNIISSKDNYITVSARSTLKKILDERIGSLSWQGVNKIENIVLDILKKSNEYSESLIGSFDTTNIVISPKDKVTIKDSRSIRENLNDILEIAYSFENNKAVFYRIFDDVHGKLHFKKSMPEVNAEYGLSSKVNIKEITILEDSNKIINNQTVQGITETSTYPEQIVAEEAVFLDKDTFEKTVIIDLITKSPAPERTAVTHINYDFTNKNFIDVVENENLLEGNVSSKSFNSEKKCGELALTIRNRTHLFKPEMDVMTSIIVKATPLSSTDTYIGEAKNIKSIERYGKREGTKIENSFVTSSSMAENIARAIVECRSNPTKRLECSLVNGSVNPFLKLNDGIKVYIAGCENTIEDKEVFIISEIKYSFSKTDKLMTLVLEGSKLFENQFIYDYKEKYKNEKTLYDTSKIFDEDISEEDYNTVYKNKRVVFSECLK